ncbi:hypothetical protein HAX54_036684 [Datura stramonium]|uniref:Uncharacterized protein n=1 Tax=Datura stramonium TaxID=4076 RepID=A0ABS8VKI8_DATST|nr:hypothetical protein [Datura stramonium]
MACTMRRQGRSMEQRSVPTALAQGEADALPRPILPHTTPFSNLLSIVLSPFARLRNHPFTPEIPLNSIVPVITHPPPASNGVRRRGAARPFKSSQSR